MTSKTKCQKCGLELAKINGRTLKNALVGKSASHGFGKISPKEWVNVCVKCDAEALGAPASAPNSFLCGDGVMRTTFDFDQGEPRLDSLEFNFCSFKFSESALESSVSRIQGKGTQELEKAGSLIDGSSSQSELLKFSKDVCEWGRGQRVWANLGRLNSSDKKLAKAYSHWFDFARKTENVDEAILLGIKVKGLGVSFASKHLRMVDPTKYAVLDSVLCKGLGFAPNEKGYKLFMTLLRDFAQTNEIDHSIAAIEAGIFDLVRQQVRAK